MKSTITCLAVLLAQALPAVAVAESAPFRVSQKARSMASALGQMPVRRFTANARVDNTQPERQFLSALGLAPVTRPSSDPGKAAILDRDDLFLEVSGGGSNLHYQNRKRAARVTDGGPARRPTLAELEPRARKFIGERLGQFVRLGRGESLNAWGVMHEIATVSAVDLSEATSELVSSTVTFTRSIDGIPVLGSSSKVRVSYAPDFSLLGVDLDWPELVELDEQRTLPLAEVRLRAQALQRARSSGVIEDASVECGYYARPGEDFVLEPVCVSSYRVGAQQDAERYADIVPIARQLPNADGWAEVRVLRALSAR